MPIAVNYLVTVVPNIDFHPLFTLTGSFQQFRACITIFVYCFDKAKMQKESLKNIRISTL